MSATSAVLNALGSTTAVDFYRVFRPGGSDHHYVVATRWLQAFQAGAAAGVVLSATNARTLDLVPIEALRAHAVDVPDDLSGLE